VPAPAILTQQLTRTFGAQTVIDHVDLAVPAGAVYGILGPMGAGKTTLVRLLLGLVPPTSGVAQLLGFDVRTDADAIRARTGVVLTAPGLYESLTALENLNLYASIWHLPAADRDARIQYLLEHLNLWPRRHERVAEWSPTMKHKLAIVRALVHRPMLLILDEPTMGLDLLDQELLRADLSRLAHQEGTTVLITTRDPAEAAALCDWVAIMHHGRLLAHGEPAVLAQRSDTARMVIKGRGFTADLVHLIESRHDVSRACVEKQSLTVELVCRNACAAIVNLVVESGADVESVEQCRADLEIAYRAILEQSNGAWSRVG
jgi:ABC-2 type transport system ATP-binding protein